MAAVVAVALVVLLTLLIGLRGVAAMRTTSDFLVASRQVSPLLNAAAVSGESASPAVKAAWKRTRGEVSWAAPATAFCSRSDDAKRSSASFSAFSRTPASLWRAYWPTK